MKHLLQHLENESLLLLYLVGELPAQDREELELMLARDGGLRAQLESLRAAQASSFSLLAALDAAEPVPAAEPAIRRISRAMQQWWVDQLARPAEAPPARSILPLVGWSVGTAIAASMIFCIWWGFNPDTIHNRSISDTQPSSSMSIPNNAVALEQAPRATPDDTVPAPAVAHDASARDSAASGVGNTSSDPNSVEIVTVDTTAEHLADLESSVRDDLVSARD